MRPKQHRLRSAALALAAALAVIAAVVGIIISPLIAAAAILGAAIFILALARPMVFFAIALSIIVASATLENLFKGTGVGFADEAVVLIALLAFSFRRLAQRKTLVFPAGSGWFVAFAAAGIASAAFQDVPAGIAAQGTFLAVKGLLFAFAAAQLDWANSDLKNLARNGAIGAAVVLSLAAVNLAVPRQWSQLILGYPSVDYTFILPALIGPFVHPAAFGRVCAIIAVAAFAYRLTVGRTRSSGLLLAAASFGGILSFRVKTLVGMFASLGYLRLRHRSAGLLVALFAILPLGILILWVPLTKFIGADLQAYIFQDSARSTITFGALDVAGGYFPFGAGFGRYGSFIAASNYSPEYVQRGFQSVYGLGATPGDGNFLTDTQWPAIVGEAGWLGALFFAIGLLRVWLSFRRASGDFDNPIHNWIRLTGAGLFLLFLVESIAAPVYSSAPAYPFSFLMTGILASIAASTLSSETKIRGSHSPAVQQA